MAAHILQKPSLWPCVAGGVAVGVGIGIQIARTWWPAAGAHDDDDGGDDDAAETKPMVLTYFPVMAKGLSCALVAEFSGLPWIGPKHTGFKMEHWGEMKASGKTPFGQLPLLEAEVDQSGKPGLVIGQCLAIVNYIGGKAGTDGKSAAEYCMSQMLIAEGEDIYGAMQKNVPTMFKKDVNEKAGLEGYDAFFAEGLPGHLAKLEALLGRILGPRFTASGTTVGELYLFGMLHQAVLIKPGCLAGFPGVAAFHKALLAHPSTARVISGESSFGEFKQYFIAPEGSQ